MKKNYHKNKKTSVSSRKLINFLKIISGENRLKILRVLKKRELPVYQICEFLNSSQNLISHHLKILKDFNLITSRKEGLKVFYKINKNIIKNYFRKLNTY